MTDRPLPIWDIQCGDIVGKGIRARTPGEAFRKLIKAAPPNAKFARLARFSSGGVWFYQTPDALERSL